MNITIKVLGVKNADAIIVRLCKDGKQMVLLIDGGRIGDARLVKKELELTLSETVKKGPDLVICTHYDSDHIGGLIKLVQDYGNTIGELWMHPPITVLNTALKKPALAGGGSILSSFQGTALLNSGVIISSIREQQRLSDIVKGFNKIRSKNLFKGNCSIKGWPEIQLLGPTRLYYKKLFPQNVTSLAIKEETTLLTSLQAGKGTKFFKNPLVELDKISKTISPVNQASAIILIKLHRKKFLFTGDAGVEAFYQIPRYKKNLKSIFWLKVPHHGSPRNINADLINLMSPQYSCISGNVSKKSLVSVCLSRSGSVVEITGKKSFCRFDFP